MNSIAIPVTIGELTFQPVSEIVFADLDATIADISERRSKNLPTYGAVVLRSCEDEQVIEIDRKIATLYPDNLFSLVIDPLEHEFDTPFDLGLHWDQKPVNSLSRHLTSEGKVEVAILCGAAQRPELENHPTRILDSSKMKRTSEILDERIYPFKLDRAIRTTLGVEDVLLFDDSQLHVFRSISFPRISQARYYKPTRRRA